MLPIIALVILVGIGGVFAYVRMKAAPVVQEEKTLKKRKISEPVNIIEVSQRPYILISPNADGRNLTLSVAHLKKEATDVDYELEYKSGSLQQGVFGSLQLGTLPASVKQLMGSCSAGGSCTYHENVTSGSLVTRFNGPENYALKTEWRYIENKQKETQMSSTDAKFQLQSDVLKTVAIAIIGDASGYPDGLKGTPESATYFLETTPKVSGKGTLTIRANTEGELTIMGYDGTKWHEFSGTVDGKTITATVDLMQAYIAVSK